MCGLCTDASAFNEEEKKREQKDFIAFTFSIQRMVNKGEIFTIEWLVCIRILGGCIIWIFGACPLCYCGKFTGGKSSGGSGC